MGVQLSFFVNYMHSICVEFVYLLSPIKKTEHTTCINFLVAKNQIFFQHLKLWQKYIKININQERHKSTWFTPFLGLHPPNSLSCIIAKRINYIFLQHPCCHAYLHSYSGYLKINTISTQGKVTLRSTRETPLPEI